jgi:hypothetical protein
MTTQVPWVLEWTAAKLLREEQLWVEQLWVEQLWVEQL